MSFKKTRTCLNGINDLNDLNGKPRGGLARVPAVFVLWHEIFKWHKKFKWHVPFKYSVPFKTVREYLNGTEEFTWHVPFKSCKSFKIARTVLNDLNDLNGKSRGGLARVPAVFFKWHEIFKWQKV